MISARTFAATAAAVTLAVTAPAVTAAPATAATPVTAAPARLTLPAPAGKLSLGRVDLHLVDRSRSDPYVPSVPFRDLMVTVTYPARRTGRPAAPQMLPGAAAHFPSFAGSLNYGIPAGAVDWAATRTHQVEDAPPLAGPRPVVLYSPGLGDPRTWGTALVENLASRGYVVVSIDHTYDASEVEFPGGRVLTSRLLEAGDPTPALFRKIMKARVDDTRFVLDELERLAAGHDPDADHRRLPAGLGRALDLHDVGMVGHSAGGFTALQAAHDDRRIRVAADLDGTLGYGEDPATAQLSTVARDGLDRPFLLMGSRENHEQEPTWAALWTHSHGWHRDVTLPGAAHGSFTDAQALVPQIPGLPAGVLAADVGTGDPARTLAAVHGYVGAFLDRWLGGSR